MALIKWEPFGDLDRFFNELGGQSLSRLGGDLAIDLYEEGGNIVAEMTLPGVDPEKIDVAVEDNFLRISGGREEEKEQKDKHYYSKEIRRGSFERVVRLPDAVDRNKVKAQYEQGVLRVMLPKTTESRENKVKVEVKK